MQNTTPQRGLILFGHGSRDPQWRAPLEAVAARAGALDTQTVARCAYLELMEPDLPSCVADLAARGVTSITIVPMFLGMGRHAREDLPALLRELQARHAQIRFHLRPAIGEDGRVVDMLARIALADT